MIESKDIFTLAGPTTPGRPLLQENQVGALATSSTFLADKKTLMNWIKRTAEAIGILRQISMDVVTRINFVALETPKKEGRPIKNAGRDSEERAVSFAKVNHLKQQLRSMIIEGLALGDGYLWKGKVDKTALKEIIQKNFKEFGIALNDTELKQKAKDEDFVGEKTLQYVPSATMNIQLHENGTKIKSYIQRTSLGLGAQTFPSSTLRTTSDGSTVGTTRRWNPKTIIHYRFMTLDGKVHGYTPMQASFPIIKILGAIKDYHGHFFESGIIADTLFVFKEGDPNQVHHEKMRQVLQEWWNNKRRAPAVVTGDMSVEKLNEWNKDMEFRLLTIMLTGIMAFSIGFPLEKIRAILGGEMKSTTGGSDISNTDYQRTIYDIQDDLEILLNTQFFNEEFGVDMKFDRSAARDEIAEVQRDEQKLNIYQKMQQMDLINKDNLVNLAEHLFPSFPSGWWNENPEPEINNFGMIPSSKIIPKGQASEALSQEKKKQQLPQGKNKPSNKGGFSEFASGSNKK